ncbi:DUF4435 domain-containing protein [Desulfospira joergensenii]|uniref:DUF4435 domain-containing protein n=1 Tax=Desulfospira joergensenii TaxID=53329 RepID=UPI0003B625F3|nr:DUF4435 domain-containing protein [Desulfospira joergensenii]
MSMIEVHSQALDSISGIYHEFLGRFNQTSKKVYGIVEGKEDLSFYHGFIEQVIPDGWQIELWHAGNKDKVLDLHSTFDWSRFSKNQVVFFIDRDFSTILGEELPKESNIFITEGYSIENYVVNRNTCDRLLCEIFNLSVVPKTEKDHILDLFDEQLNIFVTDLIPVMAWILVWKRSGEKPCLNDIFMKHIFSFNDEQITLNQHPKEKENIQDYIHSQCNIKLDNNIDISQTEEEIRGQGNILMLTRGKYLLWFLVEFAAAIHTSIGKFSAEIKAPPKIHVTVSQANANVLVAPRARIPEALRSFLKNTLCVHTKQYHSAA